MRTLLLASLALVGCAEPVHYAPPARNVIVTPVGINVPHNADASRTWWVWRDPSGNEHIVFCDAAMLASGKMCAIWPAL